MNNPYLTGTDPSPLAFTSLFSASNILSTTSLNAAQAQFSITYLTATYLSSSNARLSTSSSIPISLQVFFSTPSFNENTLTLTISNVQIIGNVGTVYFALVLYKQISKTATGSTFVNIRMNEVPTAWQVMNCKYWQNYTASGCARAVYSGVTPLTVTMTGVQKNSLYMLYYLPAS